MVALTLATEAERGEVQFARVDEEGIVCIYVLCDPGQGAIRYIGSAKRPIARLVGHLAVARSGGLLYPVSTWIKELLDTGVMPEMYVIERVEPSAREEAEERWTAWFEKRGHVLLNRKRPNFGKRAERAEAQARQEQRNKERRAKYNAALMERAAKPPPDLVTVESASRRRGCSTATIYYWIKAGSLTPVHFNGALCVKVAEVDRLPPRGRGRPKGSRVTDPTVLQRIPRGEQVIHARLTETLVREMRHLYRSGGITQKQMAHRYGVSDATVFSVLARRTWKHVTDGPPQEAARPQQGEAG